MINELLFWAAHSSDDAAWRIYAQSRGINCAPRGDHTRRLHTPSRRECSQRTTDHQERGEHTPHRPEREKRLDIHSPKVFKIITANHSHHVCVCVIFVIHYIGTNFLTNQPEQRGSPVRRWQITGQHPPGRHMAREKWFHVIVSRSAFCFSFFSLSRPGVRVSHESRRTLSREKRPVINLLPDCRPR